VRVNGQDLGVYVNVEERDKQFLKNRGLWFEDRTWLYEIDDIGGFELEEGDPHSPLYSALCYAPFQGAKKGARVARRTTRRWRARCRRRSTWRRCSPKVRSTRSPRTQTRCSPTARTSGTSTSPRTWGSSGSTTPGDLDAAITNVDAHLYGRQSGRNRFVQTPYESVILNHPDYRAMYNSILMGMTDPSTGTLSEANLHAFLGSVEPVLAQALAEDPTSPSTRADTRLGIGALRP
jgi:hypothetical protein